MDAAYIRLIERSLRDSGYTAIATHDEHLIDHAIAFTERETIARDRFEFQMLHGVRPKLQLDLARRGSRCSSPRPSGQSGFHTSCAVWPSALQTSASSSRAPFVASLSRGSGPIWRNLV